MGQHRAAAATWTSNAARVGQGVGPVLAEHLQADRADQPRPDRETLAITRIVAGKAELVAYPFEIRRQTVAPQHIRST